MNLELARSDIDTLRDILIGKSLKNGISVTLSSGSKSDIYVDAKLTTYFPEAMPIVGRVCLQKIREYGWTPKAVGGMTMGADPIAFSIARESKAEFGYPIDAFVVRNNPKHHGMGRFIVGLEVTRDLPVVILDDVCTRGKSTGEAICRARESGMNVLGALCLVDREQGACEFLLDAHGCELMHVFTLSELLRSGENN